MRRRRGALRLALGRVTITSELTGASAELDRAAIGKAYFGATHAVA